MPRVQNQALPRTRQWGLQRRLQITLYLTHFVNFRLILQQVETSVLTKNTDNGAIILERVIRRCCAAENVDIDMPVTQDTMFGITLALTATTVYLFNIIG